MQDFNPRDLKRLYRPSKNSHKGENGKLLIIAGSKLFHAASLWPLTVASRIVDMVFYSSVLSNNEIVQKNKEKFKNGIIIPREKIEDYINESDAILMGPGLPRENGIEEGDDDTKELTEKLLLKYQSKKWVVDGGSLQTISPEKLPKTAIVTPHKKEFIVLFGLEPTLDNAKKMAQKYNITILLKGEKDFVCDRKNFLEITGGNPGMTKGGTGDVLAGLTAALYCKNDPFLSACCASYINKKAAESIYKRMGIYYNASDLADEIPLVMNKLVL